MSKTEKTRRVTAAVQNRDRYPGMLPEDAEKASRVIVELLSINPNSDASVANLATKLFPGLAGKALDEAIACVRAGAVLAKEIAETFRAAAPTDRLIRAASALPVERRKGVLRGRVISLMHEFDFQGGSTGGDQFWRDVLWSSAREFGLLHSDVITAERAQWRNSEYGNRQMANVFSVAAGLSLSVGAFGDIVYPHEREAGRTRHENARILPREARERVAMNFRNSYQAYVRELHRRPRDG